MLFRDLMRDDPWSEVSRLRNEMNRLFDQANGTSYRNYPGVNVFRKEDSAVVTAELAGYDPKDVSITVVSDELTIKGERKPTELKNEEKFHRQERAFGQFERTVRLPFAIESDKVEANFSNGVLTINLPRAEADKPRTISIKAS